MSGRAYVRILAAALVLAAASAGILAWRRSAVDRRHLATGPGRWIWYSHELSAAQPVAFAAWKEFRLPDAPRGPLRALLFVDREGTLAINGTIVGRVSQKPGDAFAAFDAAAYLRAGENRVRITASHPTGAGGVLFSLELPDGSVLGSDATWRVEKVPADGTPPHAAAIWGKPPLYPWRYPATPAP